MAQPAPGQGARPGTRRFAISIVVSALLVTFLLRDVGAGRVVATIRDAYWPGIGLAALAFAAMLAARVARYRVLLSQRVGLVPLTLITMVRGMLADLLPARLGSLSYVYLVRTRAGVPLDDALSSFLLALVFDMVAIAPLLLLAMAIVGVGLEVGSGLVVLAVLLLAVSALGLWFLAPLLRVMARALIAASTDAGGGLLGAARTLGNALHSTAGRVEQVRRRGVLVPVFLLSLAVRLTKFGGHYFLLQAVLVPLGVAWGSLGFFESFLGVAGAELSAMLPISGLAGFGTWEAAWTLGFTHLGLTPDQAVLSGFATHVLSQLHDYTLGILALIALMWPGRRSRTRERA